MKLIHDKGIEHHQKLSSEQVLEVIDNLGKQAREQNIRSFIFIGLPQIRDINQVKKEAGGEGVEAVSVICYCTAVEHMLLDQITRQYLDEALKEEIDKVFNQLMSTLTGTGEPEKKEEPQA